MAVCDAQEAVIQAVLGGWFTAGFSVGVLFGEAGNNHPDNTMIYHGILEIFRRFGGFWVPDFFLGGSAHFLSDGKPQAEP